MRFLLQRYLGANFIKPFLVGTTFFVIFLLTFQLFRITDLIISKGLGYPFVGELIWEISLSLIPLALPLSIYFSTLYSLGKASDESELVIMRSVGMSKFQLLMPYMIVAILAGGLLFFINDTLAPRSKISFKQKVYYLKTKGTLTEIKSGEFFTLIPKVTLFTQEFNGETNELKEVFIHFRESESKERVIVAENGKILREVLGSGAIEMKLLLFNGNILQKNKDESEKIVFQKYIFPISLDNDLTYTPKPKNMEGVDLEKFLSMGPDEFQRRGRSLKDYRRLEMEYHNRRNIPILLIVLTLLGFSLGFRNNRGKSRKGLWAFLYLIGFYIVYFMAMSIGSSGSLLIPIPFLIYGPTAILFFIFCIHYKNMDWVS